MKNLHIGSVAIAVTVADLYIRKHIHKLVQTAEEIKQAGFEFIVEGPV